MTTPFKDQAAKDEAVRLAANALAKEESRLKYYEGTVAGLKHIVAGKKDDLKLLLDTPLEPTFDGPDYLIERTPCPSPAETAWRILHQPTGHITFAPTYAVAEQVVKSRSGLGKQPKNLADAKCWWYSRVTTVKGQIVTGS